MGLNIKKSSTEAAIRELAARTGESLTDAVENAVREKLERARATGPAKTLEEFHAAIKPIQDEIARHRRETGDKRTARELMDELYDENGLPV